MGFRDQRGITFISVIFLVVMIGFMLALNARSWSRIVKREKEEELLFRGSQIFWAVSSWYAPRMGGHPPVPLRELKDLLKDPRYVAVTRHLRREYLDPVTGTEFEVIKRPDGGIVGVRSTSSEKPIKQANFDPWFKHFEGKEKYSDWLFVPSSQRKLLPQTQGGAPAGAAGGGQAPTIPGRGGQ